MDEDLLYPEKLYYRNSVVIGDLPKNIDFNKLINHFDDVTFWKLIGKTTIPDLQNSNLKAIILTYADEESARMSNLRFKTASNISFTLYDGQLLFYYCKKLDLTCDIRSRNVLISGVNFDKPKDTYFDLLGGFGTISYLEVCSEGEIPKVRVEFTRATSAFAAVLSLQDTFGPNAVVTLEIPLFPIHPIAPIPSPSTSAPIQYIPIYSDVTAEEITERAIMLCTMNLYQDQHTFTSSNGIQESTVLHKESVDECVMETVSFGIPRKLFRDRANYPLIISWYMQNYFDRQENMKRVMQSTKKIMSFNSIWNEMIPPLVHKM